jgi:hypothetical protein
MDSTSVEEKMSTEEDFLEKPVAAVQDDLFVLDAIKGLEALAEMVASAAIVRYPEFKFEEKLKPLDDIADVGDEDTSSEPIDDLHHFLRETTRFAKGARQQLEQRIFGGAQK